jgi:hypothetical protein
VPRCVWRSIRRQAAAACPVGCIVVKRTGYERPYGERLFDARPIGSEIESKRNA